MGAKATQPRDQWNPRLYAGGESVTYPNGMIQKMGSGITAALHVHVTYATPFPNGFKSIQVTAVDAAGTAILLIDAAPAANNDGFEVTGNVNTNFYWVSWGW